MKWRILQKRDDYYIYNSIEFQNDKDYFDNIINEKVSNQDLEVSLFRLSKLLNDHYDQKVIILIDEYDTPIHSGHFEGYYSEMIGFMRNFLSEALKDNKNLEKAMLTGVLRVAKESIFSGLNNLKVYTLLEEEYSKIFGFTEEEVNNLLLNYDCNEKVDIFKAWYNGYIFGDEIIYNPWSSLYYLSSKSKEFKPHWVNTGENSIIKTLLAEANEDIKLGLENLYKGEFIETTIKEDVVMNEISLRSENIWSFLLLSGYLKVINKRVDGRKIYYRLAIPNYEIISFYEDVIERWAQEGFIDSEFKKMLSALTQGDIKNFSKIFKRYVVTSFSYFDTSGKDPEKVYHAFVLGMLVSLSGTHEVVSNRESGIGRYDVSLIPKDIKKLGIIFEFKRYDKEDEESIEEMLDIALNQIEEKKYDTELKNRGIENIIKLAIVFNRKEVHIKQGS